MAQLASLGDEIKIWDATSLTLNEQFFNSADVVKDLCWNHDGTLLASSCKSHHGVSVRMFGNGKRSCISHSFQLPTSCCCVDFASQYLLAGCDDGTLHILDVQNTKLHKSYTANKFPITVARWNWNDQNIAFGCQSGQIMLYNVITGQASSPFKPLSTQAISQLRYNPYRKSSLASATEDGVVSFWDTNTRSLVHAFQTEHQAPATDLAFSPVNDQLMVSIGLDKRLVLYDVQGKKSIKTIVADYPLTSLDMQDGSMVAVGTSRGKILMYDLRKAGVPVVTVPAHKSSVKKICFSRKEVSSAGASQSREILPSAYSEVNNENRNINNSTGYMDKSVDNGIASSLWDGQSSLHNGVAIPSFLQDESSSLLNQSTNNNTGSYAHMSPVISGHQQIFSVYQNSRENVTGASSLYSFLQNESSHLSHRSDADNTDSYLMKQSGSINKSQMLGVSQDPPGHQIVTSSSIVSGNIRTPPRLPSHSEKSHTPNNVHFKLSPNSRQNNGDNSRLKTSISDRISPSSSRVSNRTSKTDSTGTMVDGILPGHRAQDEVFATPPKEPIAASDSAIALHQSPSSLSSKDIHHMLGQMRKEIEELKVEVKAVIKAELKQPQATNRISGAMQISDGEQDKSSPQLFQEEYLRKLIRDELEVVMEQTHGDILDIKVEMHRLHAQMWWWLDHRFSEQLHNPVLMEHVNRLSEEVNRLRRSCR